MIRSCYSFKWGFIHRPLLFVRWSIYIEFLKIIQHRLRTDIANIRYFCRSHVFFDILLLEPFFISVALGNTKLFNPSRNSSRSYVTFFQISYFCWTHILIAVFFSQPLISFVKLSHLCQDQQIYLQETP